MGGRSAAALPRPLPSILDFELDESDVLWPSDPSFAAAESHDSDLDLDHQLSNVHLNSPQSPYPPLKSGLTAALSGDRWRLTPEAPPMGRSVPVNVPGWSPRWASPPPPAAAAEEAVEGFVPPHVMVARSHVTSFSVFEGAGRTLKGRDLRRVRNAVMRQTGFLD